MIRRICDSVEYVATEIIDAAASHSAAGPLDLAILGCKNTNTQALTECSSGGQYEFTNDVVGD